MAILEIFLVFVGFPIIAAAVHKGGGLRRAGWFICIAIIGLFAVALGGIITLLAVDVVLCIVAGATGENSDTSRYKTSKLDIAYSKNCPYCAEIIKKEAILCRFCGKDISLVSSMVEGQFLMASEKTKVTTHNEDVFSDLELCPACNLQSWTALSACEHCGKTKRNSGP